MIDLSVLVWPAFGLLAIIAVALPLWVFFRVPEEVGGGSDSALDRVPALRVYQDQLAGIDNDLRWGRINQSQAADMSLEIKRRMLRIADQADAEKSAKAISGVLVSLLVIAGVMAGGGLYLLIGSPHLAGVAPRPAQQANAPSGSADVQADAEAEEVLAELAAHLDANPNDIRGLSLMARSLWGAGNFSGAADIYSRLAALEPDNIDHRISMGEVLLDAMRGRMTPAARLAFMEASQIDPDHPAPIFYAGESHYQAGDARRALDIWQQLVASSSPDAPWIPDVTRKIRAAEKQLGISSNVGSGMPVPGAEAREMVANMSEDERAAFIGSMVSRLEDRLTENPDDLEGWLNLARTYRVLDRNEDAKTALQRAMEIAPDDLKERIAAEIADLE